MTTIQAMTYGAMLALTPSLVFLAVVLAKDWVVEARRHAAEHQADNNFRQPQRV